MKEQLSKADPRRVVTVLVALAAFPAGSVAISGILAELEWRVLLVGLCASLLSVGVIRRSLRRHENAGSAAAVCFGFSMFAAVLNSPFSLTLVGLSMLEPEALLFIPVGIIFATVMGLIITIPLGLLFASAYAVLVRLTYQACEERPVYAGAHILRIGGVWLAAMGMGSLVALIVLASSRFASSGAYAFLGICCALLVVIGGKLAIVAHLRLQQARDWLGRVRSGRIDGWSVAPLSQLDDETVSRLRPFLVEKAAPTAALMRHYPGVGAGAYRTGERLEPIALI